MANITEESNALADLLKQAESKDKTTTIKPQECSLDDDCEACGS